MTSVRLPRRLRSARLTNVFTSEVVEPVVHRNVPWLLLGNAFFVAAEFAVMSARRSQIEPLHEAIRADGWFLQDMSCHGFVDGRGLAVGHVFTADGTHAATVAQEVLLRRRRQ